MNNKILSEEEMEQLYGLLADHRTFSNDEETFVRFINQLLAKKMGEAMADSSNTITLVCTCGVLTSECPVHKGVTKVDCSDILTKYKHN